MAATGMGIYTGWVWRVPGTNQSHSRVFPDLFAGHKLTSLLQGRALHLLIAQRSCDGGETWRCPKRCHHGRDQGARAQPCSVLAAPGAAPAFHSLSPQLCQQQSQGCLRHPSLLTEQIHPGH